MNEGGCDPDGRFYAGSMAYEQTPGAASLYRLDPDGSLQVVLDQVTVSNGLEWSPDGALAYYNDTASHRIDVFDYDPASGLTGRRPFVELPDRGRPDGLTVDADGRVWTAVSNAGAVHCYEPTGVLEAVVRVPAEKVTACTFGGELLDQLFITTSREGVPAGGDPLAGSLFVAEPGVHGLPAREFFG
jgi:sugar lactone lactonase YvrE